jgi:hypothetical protein
MNYSQKILIVLLTITISAHKTFASDNPGSSVYQYAVLVGTRTAYCWIPPKAKQVRGIIISLSNLLERKWLEDPIIRKTAEQEGLAIIWVGPVPAGSTNTSLLTTDMQEGAGEALQKMLTDLSEESGYQELAFAPLIPMGHSANGSFSWNVAAWNPARTIAVIPVKTVPFPVSFKFQGIPVCYMVGETTEWPQYRVPDPATKPGDRDFFWPVVKESALLLRAANENNLISLVTDPGGGHFDWSEKQAKFLALFISKACKYRLPLQTAFYGMVTLKKINRASGWLTDTGGMEPDEYEPAAYADYKGDPKQAYWFFDKETALAAVAFNGDRKKRKKQMITFMQDGKPLAVAKQGFASLSFRPTDPSLSFQLEGGFVNEVPAELKGSGQPLGHAPGSIKFQVITGPAVQTGERSFKLQVDRAGTSAPVWIQAEHPGNEEYRRAVQPGQMQIPSRLTDGKLQRISFPFKKDHDSKTRKITLHASSDSRLPVNYYVVAGPAYIKENELVLTKIPLWSKFPVKITVVAYQWGTMTEPLYQSAEPAIAIIYIHSKNQIAKHPVREQIIIDILLNYLLQLR